MKGGCEASKCGKCQKKIKSFQSLTGLHCVWCHLKVGMGGGDVGPRGAGWCHRGVPVSSIHPQGMGWLDVVSAPQIHEDCKPAVPPACDCGLLRDHILPPSAIYPVVLVSSGEGGGI